MAHVQEDVETDHRERIARRLERHVARAPDWTPPQKLALACRILFAEGHESALAGQLSARGEAPGTYRMLSFGLGLDEACASNIVLCDDELDVLEGDGMVNAANRFHLWIYRHRPDVRCVVHTHAPHASALSMTGEPLAVSHMDTALFHDDCAFLASWPGVPIGDEEGRVIHEALGDKRSILLAHHGLLTAAASIEEATVLAVFLERAASWQLMARSLGPIAPLDPVLAREAHDWRLQPSIVTAQFHYFARRVLREGDRCLA